MFNPALNCVSILRVQAYEAQINFYVAPSTDKTSGRAEATP